MSKSITIAADVVHSRLQEHSRKQLFDTIAKFDGKRITITIGKLVKRRSSNQSRFMHGPFFKAIMQAHADAGEELTLEQVKEMFKRRFGVHESIRLLSGIQYDVLKSTALYTTIECEEAMERARAKYATYGIELPFPNEAK